MISDVLNGILPPVQLEPFEGVYGCRKVLREYCGISSDAARCGFLNYECSNWQHGWIPPEQNVDPELVVGWTGESWKEKKSTRFFVARADHKEYLESHGYMDVHSVGLPIVYIPPRRVTRIPRSLLVMPSHSLDVTNHDWDFRGFIKTLTELLDDFETVVACVHPACLRKGYWVREFTEIGIPIISGADSKDQNALLRMSTLFSSFSHVVGNGFGSHLVYAYYFGATAFCISPWADIKEDDFKELSIYQNCPVGMRELIRLNSMTEVQKHHPHFFDMNRNVGSHWADWQIGRSCQRSPFDTRKLLGWDLTSRLRTSFGKRICALRQHLYGWRQSVK